MSKEKNQNPRSQFSMTSFPDPETSRAQAEQKARAIALPDLDSMTHEEIRQMVHEMQVKQIEADLQIFAAGLKKRMIRLRYQARGASSGHDGQK